MPGSNEPGGDRCTRWRRPPGGEKEVCGMPAVEQRGVRCRNGCMGEGVLNFRCDDHPFITTTMACSACGRSPVEFFPARTVLS